MVNLRRILITTDLSEHSTAAFEYAFSFGLLYASKVYVLYVVDNAPPLFTLYGLEGDPQLHAARVEEAGRTKLDRFILDHVGTEKKVVPAVRSGVAEEEIINFANEENIDIIVMATHGWTGLKHIVLGSVAEKVVRRSNIPVLTVKPKKLREEIVRAEDVESELHLKWSSAAGMMTLDFDSVPNGSRSGVATMEEGKKTILIYSPDLNFCFSLSMLFQDRYNVITTTNAGMLKSFVSHYSANLLIMDAAPSEQILEHLHTLKDLNSHLPIIMLYVYSPKEATLDGKLRQKVDSVFYKPFDLAAVSKRINELLPA